MALVLAQAAAVEAVEALEAAPLVLVGVQRAPA